MMMWMCVFDGRDAAEVGRAAADSFELKYV